jgi:hypothetical protein
MYGLFRVSLHAQQLVAERHTDGDSLLSSAEHPTANHPAEAHDSAPARPAPNGSAMFSAAPTTVQAGGLKPDTEQLNLRIRADLYRQLDRVSVILGARRGVPTNRVTVVEEALAAYFEANRTG